MIGWPELIVLAVIVLLFFGYRYLPRIGRSAGSGLRSGIDKTKGLSSRAGDTAKDLSSRAGDKVQDRIDPQAIGRSAGRTLREVRETRDAFTGKGEKANSSD